MARQRKYREGEQKLTTTYLTKEARDELKCLAALNKVSMIEMLDVILVHRCNYVTAPRASDMMKAVNQ